MASSDFVTAMRPAWKAPTNNAVAVADADAVYASWPPLSQPSPSKFPENKRKERKGIRGLSPQSQSQSQSQQLPFPPPHQTRRPPNHYRRFMPPPPPYYVPPPTWFSYAPTLPPASSLALPTPSLCPPPPPPPCELRQKMIQQINYYFCEDNLAKDVFLRSKMDDEGWVPVHTIASFPRVSQLTNSCEVILDCMKDSDSVEVDVDDGKLRRRDNWIKWILPTSSNSPNPNTSPNRYIRQ